MESSSHAGRVLQGYFRIEQFRNAEPRGAIAQLMPPRRGIAAPGPPRPDLLPAKMRAMVGQPKGVSGAGEPLRAASQLALPPETLPGMGPVSAGGLGGVRGASAGTVAQARSGERARERARASGSANASANANQRVLTTLLPVGQLRVIGPGRPLEPQIRREMESLFQSDFSSVRVHEGLTAQAMGALAFTLGEELHFAPGRYQPMSRDGLKLIGHELTHVLQQRTGRARNPYRQGMAIVQDPELEAEAEWMAQRAADSAWSGYQRPRGAKWLSSVGESVAWPIGGDSRMVQRSAANRSLQMATFDDDGDAMEVDIGSDDAMEIDPPGIAAPAPTVISGGDEDGIRYGRCLARGPGSDYIEWAELESGLSSRRPQYLILMCHHETLRDRIVDVEKRLLAISRDGHLPAILVLAVCSGSIDCYQRPLADNYVSLAQQLANKLAVTVVSTSRPLLFEETVLGKAFARDLNGNLRPNDGWDALWQRCRQQTSIEELTHRFSMM